VTYSASKLKGQTQTLRLEQGKEFKGKKKEKKLTKPRKIKAM